MKILIPTVAASVLFAVMLPATAHGEHFEIQLGSDRVAWKRGGTCQQFFAGRLQFLL